MDGSERNAAGFSPRIRQIVVGLLIVVGAQAWLILGRGDYGLGFQRWLLLGALVLALIPPVNRFVIRLLDRIRHPSPRAARIAAICIAVAAACYLPITGLLQGRNFQPKWQDEMSYLIQCQMLSRGRLWMPAHPLADFFDSFQLIVQPVYASMYFPGAAMLYVWGTILHVPHALLAAAMCGATVGLVYLIFTELIDGVGGALAALMLVALTMFRKLSLMIGGHPPVMLLAALMFLCWLRWRRNKRLGWAAAVGAFAGWLAITRPLDAVVLAAPVALDMLLSLRGSSLRRWVSTMACAVVAAAPFLGVQVAFNVGVTGKWYGTPFEFYADRDYPGTSLGFHKSDPNLRPASKLPQKQKFHDEWTAPAIQRHQPDQIIQNWLGASVEQGGDLDRTLADTLPSRFMIALLPAGLAGLADRRRLMLWLTFPLWIVLFSLYTWLLPHYAIIVAPAIILTALAGADVISQAWPRARNAMGAFITAAIVILSLSATSEFNRFVQDEWFDPGGLRKLNDVLAGIERRPAVVLFRFTPDCNPHEEPVYNIDVAWPDDAPVIRAHDLGRRNIEIYRYYAQRQPQRAFYLYDRSKESLQYLGMATDLARQ